jgi:uncharacterized protein DUF1835
VGVATLHVTNGDSAARGLRQSAIAGAVLPWRELLHEGPVPEGLAEGELREVRARFLGGAKPGDYERALADFERRDRRLAERAKKGEIVLWFEADLFDQLELIQILDQLSRLEPRSVALVCVDGSLGGLSPRAFPPLLDGREPIGIEQLEVGRRAWRAFRSPDPAGIEALLHQDLSPLPFLPDALVRHLEQFPWLGDGLSRSERALLRPLVDRPRTFLDMFVEQGGMEERPFLGDSTALGYLVGLAGAGLVRRTDGRPLAQTLRRAMRQELVLTETGRRVLAGELDSLPLRQFDRWLGGAHLISGTRLWRWDPTIRGLREER